MCTEKYRKTSDLPWDFFDQTFCTAEALEVREASPSRALGLEEIQQSYLQGAELIIRDVNVLKSLLAELLSLTTKDRDNDDFAEADELIEEILERLVEAEERIKDSEQIVSDLTFAGYEEGDAFWESQLPRGCHDIEEV